LFWCALRNVATKDQRPQTDLVREGLNDLAAKYGGTPPKSGKIKTRRACP
jgi:hypothetical protein